MKLFRVARYIILSHLLMVPLFAQDSSLDGFSLAYSMSNNKQTGGIGLAGSSPGLFTMGKASIRLSVEGNLLFTPIQAKNSDQEESYFLQSIRYGFTATGPYLNHVLRPYTTLGGIGLFTNKDIDSESLRHGIFTDFGFELPVQYGVTNDAYFIELGTQNFIPQAMSNTGKIYVEGFRIAVGMRWYF